MRPLAGKVWRRLRPTPPPPNPYPDWTRLVKNERELWNRALAESQNGPRVLIATSAGGYIAGMINETMLAAALTLRGAQVHVLLCDEVLPACMQGVVHTSDAEQFAKMGPQMHLCQKCFAPGYKNYQSLSLPVHRYGDFISPDERQMAHALASETPADEIGNYRSNDVAVGEHALAGALRFFARGQLEGEPHGESILRRYFEASLLTTYMARRLFNSQTFVRACFHHGIYVPQGLIGEVARQEGVPVVNWNPAYRKQCFIFSHHDTYHHVLLEEPVASWEDMEWTPEMEEEILDYLKSRWRGTRDWIWFHEKPEEDLSTIAAALGVDFSRPCIGLLTNVMWDAQLHYRANAFPNMLTWLVDTIRYFGERPELQLLIRIHPAEIRGTLPSRQLLTDELRRAFPKLPQNVFVITPESEVSTYAAMAACNAVIIYGTKTGVELTSMGIPTIVAGEAWIRNKGITIDASSRAEYFKILDGLPFSGRMPAELTQRARKYAYHFFFRRMIPVPLMRESKGLSVYELDLDSLSQLLPGVHPGLDVICDGILKGTEFVYQAERVGKLEMVSS
ncbi:MAG TPA: hypothetical protein VJM50_00785 [Pyrinomonadaceae bacterium]|nr:hypothetical protein [Pyrinomonadaceae bacterium]